MVPIIDKSLLVPVSTDRNNYLQLACGLFNTETLAYTHGTLATEAAANIKRGISIYKGTLLFVHKRFKVFGILKDSKNKSKPLIYWVHEKHAEIVKNKILNYEERLNIIDISNEPIEVFKGTYREDVFEKCSCTDSTLGRFSSYDKLVKTIMDEMRQLPVVEGGQSNIVIDPVINNENTVEIKTEDAVVENEDTVMNICEDALVENVEVKVTDDEIPVNSEEAKFTDEEVILDNEDCSTVENEITDYTDEEVLDGDEVQAIVKEENQTESNCEAEVKNSELMKALIEATKTFNETKKELKEVTESYKEAMAKSFGEFDLDVETKFVGVNDIKGDLEGAESNKMFTESVGTEAVYEFILKIMKVDDSISLPRTFYEKLTTVIKRNMMLSRDSNKYDSIVLIRFDKTSRDNLVARVEYDSTKDSTRVTVIKQFNGVELTSGQLLDYETKFNQWRRMHSYRTT